METRANFIWIGAFTLAVVAGAFLFVLWFSGLAKTSDRQAYQVLFTGSVSGLSRGSAVLFNGLKVGEVTAIDFLENDPSRVAAVIEISARAPVKTDTKARLEVQGLTGAAVIALTGGAVDAPALAVKLAGLPVIIADRSDYQNLLESAQRLTGKLDDIVGKANKLIGDNGPALSDAIRNFDLFSKALGDNAGGVNGLMSSIGGIGEKLGPATERVATLAEDLDKLVKAIDEKKVQAIIGNAETFSTTLAQSKTSIDGILGDTAALAKHLNDSSAQLEGAMNAFNALMGAFDSKKVAGIVDGVGAFAQTLSDNRASAERLLKDAAELSGKLNGSADTVHSIVGKVDGFADILADNRGAINGLVGDAASLVKRLNDSSAKVDATLGAIDDAAKAFDGKKMSGIVDNVGAFAQTLGDNKGAVDRALKDAAELAAKLNQSADKIDALMASVQSFVGSEGTKGALAQVGDAAKSVRQLADDLNLRTRDIAAGLTRFSGAGLREYEALAIDGRRAVNDFDRALHSLEKNPSQLIFGAKPSLPEYHGGP